MTTATKARGLPSSLRIWGTVASTNGASVQIKGLSFLAKLGDGIEIEGTEGPLPGEIIAIDGSSATVLLIAEPRGLATGQRAYLNTAGPPCPGTHWLGHAVDAFGHDIQSGTALRGSAERPTDPARTGFRRPLGRRLSTGLAALDTALPLCQGQRLGVFAGSGVGKSLLMVDLTLGVEADVVVVGLIGERSREVGDFVRHLHDRGGMGRAVVIAATSDQSALVKRRAAKLVMRTARHFQDQGLQVLCLFDSLTRFAEAHREIALAAGEPPALRAFPPSTAQAIASLCEQAGAGWEGTATGDITAIFTVLVAGSDMEEPVADMVRGMLDGHVILDRAIAERGRFPAIDLLRSVSRSAPAAWNGDEETLVTKARRLIAAYEEAEPMIQAGLYTPGADATLDEAVERWADLDAFIGSATPGIPDAQNFERLAELLGIAAQTDTAMAEPASRTPLG